MKMTDNAFQFSGFMKVLLILLILQRKSIRLVKADCCFASFLLFSCKNSAELCQIAYFRERLPTMMVMRKF